MRNGITVGIPLYNEEAILESNVKDILEHLMGLGTQFELILHDNGSVDRTSEIGANIEKAFPGKVTFMSSKRRVVGLSFKESLRASRYDFFVSLDIDIPVNMGFIEESVKLLEGHDIVIGSKRKGNEKRFLPRTFIGIAYTLLIRMLFGLRFSDYSPSAKAYKKSSIIGIIDRVDDGSFFVTELLFLAKKMGMKTTEMPVECMDLRGTKFNIYRECLYRAKQIIKRRLKPIC